MNFTLISKSALFRGIQPKDLEAMLNCLQAHTKEYKKGEYILRMGMPAEGMGLLMSGSAHLESDDVWGNRTILDVIAPGEVFAEVYACVLGEAMMVNVVAAEACEVLFLNIDRVLTTCSTACAHHSRLVRNLLTVLALKSLNLTRKMFHITPKTIRGKLLSYLSYQAIRQGKYRFEVPFNRQQLADYLGVDRSALSNELSKMRAEGILDYDKNVFTLKEMPNDPENRRNADDTLMDNALRNV